MSEQDDSAHAELKDEFRSVAGDLRQMARLRWELARLELQAAVGAIKRLVVALVALGVMVLVGLPVLVVAAADGLDGRWGMARAAWLLIFGLVLSIGGLAGGWLAWRRFRGRFVGMEETLEQFHEDAAWLRQWTARDRSTPDDSDDGEAG